MTILVATDLSENSRVALQYGAAFARALGQSLTAVAVVELWERDMRQLVGSFDGDKLVPSPDARAHVETFVRAALGEDLQALKVDVKVLVGHPPAEAIAAAADRMNAQLVVVGTSGHSKIGERFFGSTTSALARESARPILAVPPDAKPGPIRKILAPVDLSACSVASLAKAHELADVFDAGLIVLHAVPITIPAIAPPLVYVPETSSEVREAAARRVEAMVEAEGLADRAEVIVETSAPHGAILRLVEEERVDLIVMGTHGRRGVEKFFLGSTAERMLRDRACPVLVLRTLETER